MAKPFGYIDASDRRIGSYVNNFYVDYPVMDFGPNAEDTFNAFLIHLGFYKIQDAIKVVDTSIRSLLKIKIGDASQGGSFLYYSQINWSNYNNTSNSIHLQLDSSLIYRYQGYVYDYDYNNPERSSTPTVEYKWCNKYLKIKDMAITNNGYQSNQRNVRNGFGHWPRNVSYTYIDGAFSEHTLKPLQNRMKYKLIFQNNKLYVYDYIVNVEYDIASDYSSISITDNSDWSTTPIVYDFTSSDKEPYICIHVCQPANRNRQPLGPSFNSTLKELQCGTSTFNFIKCSDIPQEGLIITCSDIVVESCYPRQPFAFGPGKTKTGESPKDTELGHPGVFGWEQNDAQTLAFFTSPPINIGCNKETQEDNAEKQYLYFSLNPNFSSKHQTISSSYSGPDVPNLYAKYYLPTLYTFYGDITYNTLDFIDDFTLSVSNELVWNDNKHYRGYLHLVENNSEYYNYPGLGDFNMQPLDSYYSEISTKKGYYYCGFKGQYDWRLEYDKHSWNFKPYFTRTTSWVDTYYRLQHNVLLSSAALYYYRRYDPEDVSDVQQSTYKKYSEEQVLAFTLPQWQKRQNMWGAPIINSTARWYYEITPNYKNDIKNIYQLNQVDSNTDWDFNSVYYRRSLMKCSSGTDSYTNGLVWNLNSYKDCGANILCWWKNTTSIPCNSNSSDELLTLYKDGYPDTEYPVSKGGAGYEPATYLDKTSSAIHSYQYIYPQSSQAPGAIAIYAVTW